MTEETISRRELARRLGVDEKAIRLAILDGKIKNGVSEDGKIIADIAMQEAKENLIGYSHNTQYKRMNEKLQHQDVGTASSATTYSEARTREKIAKSNLATLEYQERKGILVNKKEVYSQLYDYGIEIKTKLLAIPDRITDELISLADDRNAFYTLLSQTITHELEILSNIPKIGKNE